MIVIRANQNGWSGSQGPYLENYDNHTNLNGGLGDVRFNRRHFEVWNGSTWEQLPSVSASIGLNSDTMNILEWARVEMQKQADRKNEADKHPMLAQALADLERAEERYEIIKALISDL
jgi:hypothetical protein